MFAFLLLAVAATAQTQLEELQCDMDLFVGVDLETAISPGGLPVLFADQTASFLFAFQDPDLRTDFVAQLHTPSVQVFSYLNSSVNQSSLNPVPLTWDDILPAVAIRPGNFPACSNVSGCDGFVISSQSFLRLFPPQARYFVIHFLVQFFQNVPPGQRRLLALQSIGFSDPLVLNMQFSDQLHAEAFATDYSEQFQYIMYGVLGGLGLLFLFLSLCICCTSTAAVPTSKGTDENTRLLQKRMRYSQPRLQVRHRELEEHDSLKGFRERITEEDLTDQARRDGVISAEEQRLHDQIELRVLRHRAGV